MSVLKRYAWDVLCVVLWLLVALGIAAEIVHGGEECKLQNENCKMQIAESPAPVLLDFYADWCGPCQTMAPTVDALAGNGYAVRRINVDEQPEVAREYGVGTIPCFVVVQQGREIDRVTGVTTIERLKVKLKAEGKTLAPRSAPPVPHPAWRYEKPVGHRAAVVRIFCQDDATTRSIGSGTLVRWNGRIVVLTARHVVKDAKRIIVELCIKRTHAARVVKVDAVWDCAVLELAGKPDGVEAVEVELGDDAMQHEGSRLESCGYGPDGKLACNSGLFIGYKRSSAAPQGPDDWMAISGRARGGDSGGPVFNQRGRLVGVLWGTDGKEVICVQAGRIHALLDASIQTAGGTGSARGTQRGEGWEATDSPRSALHSPLSIIERNPTPPRPGPLTPVPPLLPPACNCAPGPEPYTPSEQTALTPKPLLPWRGGAEQRDKAQTEQIDRLIELERMRAANASQPTTTGMPKPQASARAEKDEPAPLLAGLCIVAGVVVGFVIYFATAKK